MLLSTVHEPAPSALLCVFPNLPSGQGSHCLEPLEAAEGFWLLAPLAAESRDALLPCFAPELQNRLSLSAEPFEGLLSCLPLFFPSAPRFLVSHDALHP